MIQFSKQIFLIFNLILAERSRWFTRPRGAGGGADLAEGGRGRRRPRCIARSGKLDRARSRLYRGQILQENMRWKALDEIYTMHSFALF